MTGLLPDLMVAVGSLLVIVGMLLLFGARGVDVSETAGYESLAIDASASSSSSRDE